MVVGDCDGVTVVPRDRIEEVLEKAERKNSYEAERVIKIEEYKRCLKENEALPDLTPNWVNEILKDISK